MTSNWFHIIANYYFNLCAYKTVLELSCFCFVKPKTTCSETITLSGDMRKDTHSQKQFVRSLIFLYDVLARLVSHMFTFQTQ